MARPATPADGSRLRRWARALKAKTLVVYRVARDARTPWYVRALAFAVAAYAFSPIDLIPDFIPVLGYLDDVIVVPLGVMLVLRLTPADVMAEAQVRAEAVVARPLSRGMAGVVIGAWVVVAGLVGWMVWRASGE